MTRRTKVATMEAVRTKEMNMGDFLETATSMIMKNKVEADMNDLHLNKKSKFELKMKNTAPFISLEATVKLFLGKKLD